MHGSGGVSPTMEAWTRQLNSMGISTFVIDGFSGRGLTSVNQDQAKLGRLNFILDIYGALEILAKHPRVDPERIVLMGFSRGGQAALYASVKRFNDDVEQIRRAVRCLHSLLSGLRDDLRRRHRRRRPADPHLPWHARRL